MRGQILAATAFLLAVAGNASGEPFPRGGSPAGAVIARKSGEDAQYVDLAGWRDVAVRQDLLPGDVLRTNAAGHLAILFSDRTQVRLARNSSLLVREIGEARDSVFRLETGGLWARAERGGIGLTVETPAASAAIRGTDWTMSVDGSGRTSVVVLEGVVELFNEYGSVTVTRGEAASATIGSAPTKTVIVDPDDREQMLFYLSVRQAFNWLPATPAPAAALRAEHRRVAAMPADDRNTADWVALAETALQMEGRDTALDALGRARAGSPSRAESARLDLVEGLILATRRDYSAAAALFARAAPALDPRRRAVARHAAFFARSLADPARSEPPPPFEGDGPFAALARAWTVAFLQDFQAAAAVLQLAEADYPDDPTLPAYRAQIALLLDDREQAREAIARALALDPDEPTALEARALLRSNLEGDVEGAREDIIRASEIAPGSTTIWNQRGIIESQRGDSRAAEAALLRAIELDPEDPASRANLAILYLDEDRLAEARVQVEAALTAEPGLDIALVARGRLRLQEGNPDGALEDLLAATTANPAHAQGLLLLAAAYASAGQPEAVDQALANAERLDPNDPATSSFAAAIASDRGRTSDAIAAARQALERARARGGDYAQVSANLSEGSLLNGVFRAQGLDAWGRYFGDAVHDPFSGAAQVDRAVAGSDDPFVNDLLPGGAPVGPSLNDQGFSGFFQGIMLSPELLAGPMRGPGLVRSPFFDVEAAGARTNGDGGGGWSGGLEARAFAAAPFPVSLFFIGKSAEVDGFRRRVRPAEDIPLVEFDYANTEMSGTGFLTARPTPVDRVAFFADARDRTDELRNATVLFNVPLLPFDAVVYDRTITTRSLRLGLGWSHTLGHHDVVNAALFYSGLEQTGRDDALLFAIPFPIAQRVLDAESSQWTGVAALNRTVERGAVTWSYGVEGGVGAVERIETDFQTPPPTVTVEARDADLRFGRAYVDARFDLGRSLEAELALFATAADGFDVPAIEPRLGIAWSPVEGHWLRAGYLRQSAGITDTTLAPLGVAGLQANQAPLGLGGHADTFAARWDAEWSPRLFTSLEYQHQRLNGLSIPEPGAAIPIDISDGFDEGRIDRLAATLNAHLGGGIGAFATVAWTDSQNTTPFGPGVALPFVPDVAARLGFTYSHPSRFTTTVAATYVGERVGDATGTVLDPYWTLDASAAWEPFDRRVSFEAAFRNILDTDFDVANALPGWGRTVTGSLKVRF